MIGSIILLTGMNPEAPIQNLFTGEALAANQGGIIGVIFAVWLLAKLEAVLHRVIPEAIDIIDPDVVFADQFDGDFLDHAIGRSDL